MKKCLTSILYLLILLFILSCASIAPPKGGEKDENKPRVLRTFPKNGTLNFKGNTVKYYFSEWIQEDKLREQIIITPRIEDYEVKVSKNILTLRFDTNSFKPNTTYNVNLREGIKDLTEGSKSDSTTLVFSTGTYLDSLQLEGKIRNGDDNKRIKDVTISLYPFSDTFKLEKSIPLYSTKTDSGSTYQIQNIKPGDYYLYAFKDLNNNNRYDKNKEAIGYIKNIVSLKSSLSIDYINLYIEDHEKPKVTYRENRKKSISKVEYNKSLKSVRVDNSSSNRVIYPYKKDKAVQIYPEFPSGDSVKLIFTSKDKFNNEGKDTLGFVLDYIDTSRCSIQTLPTSGSLLEPTDSIEIFFSRPFTSNSPSLLIKNGNEVTSSKNYKDRFTINQHVYKNSISILSKNKWEDTVQITLYPQMFKPVTGYFKDTTKLFYTKKNVEQYGSIGGTVQTSSENLLIQLLSKDNIIVKQIDYKKDFLFEYLSDGEYKIRVVVDENRNQVWDQGFYETRKMPEMIFHYPDPIKLKSNWEILDLKLSF